MMDTLDLVSWGITLLFPIAIYFYINHEINKNKKQKQEMKTYILNEIEIQLLIDFGFIQNTKHGHINLVEQKEHLAQFTPIQNAEARECSFKQSCEQFDEASKRQFCGCYNTPPKQEDAVK